MGRYFQGDIEGKFWFGVQSSTAADRFGSTGFEPSYIEYCFCEEHLEDVESEIKNIIDSLGEKKEQLDKFFEDNNGYTDEQIEKLGISKLDLENYADLGLGIKIRDCIKENGECNFQAEI